MVNQEVVEQQLDLMFRQLKKEEDIEKAFEKLKKELATIIVSAIRSGTVIVQGNIPVIVFTVDGPASGATITEGVGSIL